ncbi:MAG: glutamate--tRNA ligase family protein [Candidatus Nomurabacteria bacterium]|nr:glutamate--tRNA ligase family protein [Candidatus Nomurabacteria bacterium]
MSEQKVITRFAPSPTGKFHVGGIRSALYNYLYARKHNGKFILRCEDTDPARSKKEYEDYFINVFKWLGLEYDEFFRQSERTEIYKKYLHKLLEEDKIYISKEEIKEEGQRSEVIRFRNPNKIVTFHDEVLGDLSFNTTELGDFIIARDIESPLYHFTVVVDDFEMNITHIIRGQEHVSNTPRQILIQEAIGAPRPIYAHGSVILNEERAKLSKRDPLVRPSLEYKDEGYLPEGLLNFMAFLGWNPGGEKEIYTLKELINAFSLERMQKPGAIFNPEKLEWFNKEHLKLLPKEKQLEYIFEFIPENIKSLPNYSKEKIENMLNILIERITHFGQIKENFETGEYNFVFSQPEYDKTKLLYKTSTVEQKNENINKTISALQEILESNFTKENVKESLMKIADSLPSRGELLHPVRFSLSGMDKSPDPFIIAEILGKNETISRLQKAL